MHCSIEHKKRTKTFLSERLLRKCAKHPDFYQIFSADFIHYSHNKQQTLYNDFSLLKECGIDFSDIITISEDLANLTAENVIDHLEDLIIHILKNQNPDGSWGILTQYDILEFDNITYGTHGGYINNWFSSQQSSSIPNAWTNALIILILMKWVRAITEYYGSYDLKRVNDVKKAILQGKNWLDNHKNKSTYTNGWGPFIPDIDMNLVNTYDTSLVYIALSYDNNYSPWGENDNSELNSIPELLLSKELYNPKSGAWYIDNRQDHRLEDVGATSYALVLLIKLMDQIDIGKKDVIEKGIEWLCGQQNDDGGWGQIKGKNSAIDKTCHALMTLYRYDNIYDDDNNKLTIIEKGQHFINSKLMPYSCTGKDGRIIQIDCWPKESNDEPCFKNSSLAISTLLRGELPIYSGSIRRSVSGLMRLYKARRLEQEFGPIADLNEAYFFCMLADYLKSWNNS